MESTHYHNTTDVQGAQLDAFTQKAITQDEEVLGIFKRYPELTASEAYRWYSQETGSNVPLTSIRRAITNLTKKGELQKTEQKREGMYGRPEYVYKINFLHFGWLEMGENYPTLGRLYEIRTNDGRMLSGYFYDETDDESFFSKLFDDDIPVTSVTHFKENTNFQP